MNLNDVLRQMMAESISAAQPADLQIGTVTAEEPLEISIDMSMQVLRRGVLYLTEAVVEKKIPVLSHSHYIPSGTLTHSHNGAVGQDLTGQYQTGDSLLSEGADTALQGENIVCWENGKELPIVDGYIILNRKLEVGDKVLLLRVQKGQKFIVLSRVFEEGS